MKKRKYKLKKSVYFLIAIILIIIGSVSIFWYLNTLEVYDENNLPTKFVSYEFVSSRTEAKLYYPGSKVFHLMGAGDRREGFAWAGAVLISDDSSEEIYDWYRQWLTSNGWRYEEHAFAGLGMSQASLQGYVRGDREKFSVAMNNPDFLGRTLGKKIPRNITVFEIVYYINPKPTPATTQNSRSNVK